MQRDEGNASGVVRCYDDENSERPIEGGFFFLLRHFCQWIERPNAVTQHS